MKEVKSADAQKITREEEKEFLESLQRRSMSERIRELGAFLMQKMGTEMPRGMRKFTWHPSLDTDGNDSAPRRTPERRLPDGTPGMDNARYIDVDNISMDHVTLRNVSHFVPGEYVLTVNGVSVKIARGTKMDEQYDPRNGAYRVDVVPENQNFMGRFRMIDVSRNPEEYLFFWMHPFNAFGPARLTPEEQARTGLTIGIIDRYSQPQFTRRIKDSMINNKKDKRTMENMENMRLNAELEALPEAELRKLSILTGIQMDPNPMISNLYQYKSHLFEVIANTGGTLASTQLREKLLGAMKRSNSEIANTIARAFKEDILVLDGNELFLKDESGDLSQPNGLDRYIVPDHSLSIVEQWFAGKLDEHKAHDLAGLIDTLTTVATNKTNSGRHIDNDRIAAVDRAIATGTVKALNSPKHWVNTKTDEMICTWQGKYGNEDKKRDSLLEFASNYSLASLLVFLGLEVEEENV